MASEVGEWDPADHLLGLVEDVVEWTGRIGERHLPAGELTLLAFGIEEIQKRQLPKVRDDLREATLQEFESAGFSELQAVFKTTAVRSVMEAAMARSASRLAFRRRPTAEALGVALDAIKEVLAGIRSLSEWIEALAELVGVVGSGAKTALAERRVLRRVARLMNAPTPPAPA